MAGAAVECLGRGVPAAVRSATRHLLRNRAWIGGSWVEAQSKKTFPVYNPFSRELIAEVSDLGEREVSDAIASAHAAQKKWAAMSALDRSSVMKRWLDLVREEAQGLASIITLETGKPILESLPEVLYGASFLEWFSEEAKRVYGDIIPGRSSRQRALVLKQPAGVAAQITPWNFPFAMVTRKAGAALAAGCSAVVKPSEETPFSALALAELAHRAGVPEGLLNVVPCSKDSAPEVGRALTSSEQVAVLSFTGSTGVGKLLMSQCAETVKKVSLELGGCAPLVVFNSADVRVAVQATISSKFRNAGQACISPNRCLVQSGIHDQFVGELVRAVSLMRQGDGFREDVTQGPLINDSAVDKVERHVDDAVSKGAEAVIGGKRNSELGSTFFLPSVLTGVSEEMVVNREETFGPVMPIRRFEEEEEAVAMANATSYGLASFFFTRDLNQAWRVAEALESGIVGLNEGAVSSELAPFGGIKQSGFGVEGSKYGMDSYLHTKYLCIGNVE